jgi:hypothetical protein
MPILYEFLASAGLHCYAFYDYYYTKIDRQGGEEDGPVLLFANMLFVSPTAVSRMR